MGADQGRIGQFEDEQFHLRPEAENDRLAYGTREIRQVRAMFIIYLAELLTAVGAVVILRA